MSSLVKKLFEVIDYTSGGLFIDVKIKRNNAERTVFVTRDEFEDWMQRTGRLDWEEQVSSDTVNPVTLKGTVEVWEYWQGSHGEQVKFDLYEFILTNLLTEALDKPSSKIFKVISKVAKKQVNNMVALAEEVLSK
jgi:hypothetical protein